MNTNAHELTMNMDVVERLKELMDNEARSCSMDYGCITPFYVYRMWGGSVSLKEITQGLTELRKQGFLLRCGDV